MKNKLKKMILLLTITSILCVAATGCSSAPVSNQDPKPISGADKTPENLPDNEIKAVKPENSTDNKTEEDIKTSEESTNFSDNEFSQSENDNGSGKYHIFDPELAEYLDADFECIVWRLEEGSFYAAEVYSELLEDGTIMSSSPSSDSTLNDSDLFQVIYDDNTYFSIRTIYENGKRHEDTDADSKDLEEYLDCQLKGSFKNDIFYATEIRMIKVQ